MYRAVDANCNCDLQSSSVFVRFLWLASKIDIHINKYFHRCWDSFMRFAIAIQIWFCWDVQTLVWLQHNQRNEISYCKQQIVFLSFRRYTFFPILLIEYYYHTLWFLYKQSTNQDRNINAEVHWFSSKHSSHL